MKTLVLYFAFAASLLAAPESVETGKLTAPVGGGIPILKGMPGDKTTSLYYAIAGEDRLISFAELLAAYAGSDALKARFALAWMVNQNGAVGSQVTTVLDGLAIDVAKSKDPRASLYRRAADKLAQQLSETGIRQDAQAAVADALKALEAKK